MLGGTHHVYVEKRGGSYRFMMASTAGELLARIDRAAASPKVQGIKGLPKKLRVARDEVQRAQIRLQNAMDSNDMKQIRQAEGDLVGIVDSVEVRMIALGREFDIDQLSGGTYVLDDKVHPDYQRSVRRTFYGPSSVYNAHTNQKLADARAAKLARYPDPLLHPNDFWCPGVPGKKPPHLAPIGAGLYALDHKVGVATHWKNGDGASPPGCNSKQADRAQWYGAATNLEVLCSSCNGMKQSGGDQFDPPVGSNFAGPNGLR
jgi:hypothetical protein